MVANSASPLTFAKIEMQALIESANTDEISTTTSSESSPSTSMSPLSAGALTGIVFSSAALFLGVIILAAWIRIRRRHRVPVIQPDTKRPGGIVIPPSPSPEPIQPPPYMQSTGAPTPPASTRSNESIKRPERTRRIVKSRPQSVVVMPYIATPTHVPQAYIQPQRPHTGSSRFSAMPLIESDGGPVLLDYNGNAFPEDFGHWVYIPLGPPRRGEIRMTY